MICILAYIFIAFFIFILIPVRKVRDEDFPKVVTRVAFWPIYITVSIVKLLWFIIKNIPKAIFVLVTNFKYIFKS